MGRSPCCDKNGLKKGPWTPEEDQRLIQYIQLHGPGNWRALPKNAGLQRCGKSCRLRWTNYLRPDIKRGRFSFEEEETIIQLHSILGNKWSAIAARLPGRTDNEIKNYWNTHIRKRLLRMGVDPVTHSPRLDFLDLASFLTSAQQLNLSSLLGLQTLVNNPEMLRLATTLLASSTNYDGNPDTILEKLQQNNQMFNATNDQASMFQPHPHHDQFHRTVPINEMPPRTTTPFPTQTHADLGINLSCQNFQENLKPSDQSSSGGFVGPPADHTYCTSDRRITRDPLDKFGLLPMNNQDFSFDSVLSTPLSSLTPLNSSSTFINSSTEDERESHCSNMLKFEIPESLDFDDFM